MSLIRLVAALLVAASPAFALSATIVHEVDGPGADDYLRMRLTGRIDRSDVSAIATVLGKYPRQEVAVHISSPGGEVEASIAIGRLLRSRRASITVMDQCHSSCIFLYGGAVERMNPARPSAMFFEQNQPNGATGLGIHRFYFAALPADAPTSKVTEARNALRGKIEQYLREMNISTQLLDAMEAIPPSRMKLLTLREANALGLFDTDPVYEEQKVAWQAAHYGISSSEYRRRSAAAESYCREQERRKDCRRNATACAFDDIYDCRTKAIRNSNK